MYKFEVGDRVRLVKDGWYCSYDGISRILSASEGYIGIVTGAEDSDGDLTLDDDDDIVVNKSCLELYPTARVVYDRLSVDNQALADNYMADLLEKQNWVPPKTKHIMVTLASGVEVPATREGPSTTNYRYVRPSTVGSESIDLVPGVKYREIV